MVIYIIMFFIWAVVLISGIIIEINTTQQVGWAASIASIFAIIVHAILGEEGPIWPEIITFFAIWSILWIIFWFLSLKWGKKIHDKEDGYLNFIGKEAIVVKKNNEEFGEVKFKDKIFRIKSNDKLTIGQKVIIKKIKGVTLFVEKKGE